MAKIFLSLADVITTVSDNNAFVYGHHANKLQNVTVNANVTNVTIDANIDQLTLTGNYADYQFFQAGNALKIVQNSLVVADLFVQDDDDGTQISFKDKTIATKFALSSSGLALNVGGITVNQPLSSDTTPPKVVSFSPLDNSSNVAAGANLVITFNEPIKAGSGYIIVNGTDTRAINVNDKTQVSISGSTLTLNPNSDLQLNASYSVQMASGVIQDLAGNNFAGILDTTTFNFRTQGTVLTGKAIDGYLKGAIVFADANNNGVLDAEELRTFTDDLGNFSLANFSSSLVVSGGIDISTNKAFKGVLSAPAGSEIVSPLTTMQQSFIASGMNKQAATAAVGKAIGVDLSQIDLNSYDPISVAVKSTNATEKNFALKLQAEALKLQSFLTSASSLIIGASNATPKLQPTSGLLLTNGTAVSLQQAISMVLESLVSTVLANPNGTLNLSNSQFVSSVLSQVSENLSNDPALANLSSTFSSMTSSVATLLAGIAEKIDSIVETGGDGMSALMQIVQYASVAQNNLSETIEKVASGELDLETLLANFTVDLLDALAASQEIGILDPDAEPTETPAVELPPVTTPPTTTEQPPEDTTSPPSGGGGSNTPPPPSTNGTRSAPATTQSSGDDILNGNQGTILGTAVSFNAANGNDEYVFSAIRVNDALPTANVTISGFSSGDKLVFNVTNDTSFEANDASYSVSDNGTDISLIVNDDGNVQLITLTGLTASRASVGGSVDSMTELATFLGTGSIAFI